MKLQLDILDREWCNRMAPVVTATMRGREFTADDLHGVLEPPENKNLFGVLMAKLRTAGSIERVGYRVSTRHERNGGLVRIWKVK